MKRAIAGCLQIAGALALAAGCGENPGGATGAGAKARTITIKGSDTMVILGQRWAEAYMHHHPDTAVQVTGGGSGMGIVALIDGGTDICESSRPLKEREREQVKMRHGKDVKEIPVALDGIAIYVHRDNALLSISLPKLKDLYTGKIRDWKDLGGPEGRIVAYGRDGRSGTHECFRELVLGGADYAAGVRAMPGTEAVVKAVIQDANAIGYGGMAYGTGVRAVPIRASERTEAMTPSLETVTNGTYPLARRLFFYTIGEPVGEVKAFVDWVLGDEGQAVCGRAGYYPLRNPIRG
jgi:phosphate transport system substrate-binding protein